MMRRAIIFAAALAIAIVAALTYRATVTAARFHLLVGPGINLRLCTDGVRYTWLDEETGSTRPPAQPPVGTAHLRDPRVLTVQMGPSTLPDNAAAWSNQPLIGGSTFTPQYHPAFSDPSHGWFEYSHVGAVPFTFALTPGTDKVLVETDLDAEEFGAWELVHNCTLFGHFDFEPTDPANVVDFSKNGALPAALLSTPTFNATRVPRRSVFFGDIGSEASPLSSTVTDVNGDGRKDLILRFRRSDTGLTCTSTAVAITATDPKSGERFYKTDSMQSVNCP